MKRITQASLVAAIVGAALCDQAVALPPPAATGSREKRLLVTCHRRESWGNGMAEIATAISALAARGDVAIEVILHPNPALAAALVERLGRVEAMEEKPDAVGMGESR